MSPTSLPPPTQQPDGRPLRRLFVGLALLTLAVTAEKVVGLSAPMPAAEAPAALNLKGYRVSALEGAAPRRGRDLSQGSLRRFRLEPRSGEPPLTLTLLPVRSRTGRELTWQSLDVQGLSLEQVRTAVPSFALKESRTLTLPLAKAGTKTSKGDEIAFGRGPADATGSTTRLQTCLTPSGVAGVSSSTLASEGQSLGNLRDPSVWAGLGQRFAGLAQGRHECLAVQLEREASAVTVRVGGHQQRPLEAAWRDLRGVLVSP